MTSSAAPRNAKRWASSGSSRIRRAERIPAMTTEAVPWMSSLKLVIGCR